jgi:Protein of unknown function (DUF2934)
MEQNLENRIRERAYEIWTASGCLDGQADQHWLEAEREILAASAAAPARNGSSRKKRPPPRRPKAAEPATVAR